MTSIGMKRLGRRAIVATHHARGLGKEDRLAA